jgi:hypothetical protein
MFKVFLKNFGYSVLETEDFSEALNKAESVGFECSILEGNIVTASFSPISGWKFYQ